MSFCHGLIFLHSVLFFFSFHFFLFVCWFTKTKHVYGLYGSGWLQVATSRTSFTMIFFYWTFHSLHVFLSSQLRCSVEYASLSLKMKYDSPYSHYRDNRAVCFGALPIRTLVPQQHFTTAVASCFDYHISVFSFILMVKHPYTLQHFLLNSSIY